MCCLYRCIYPGCRITWAVEEAQSVSNTHGLCPKHARLRFLEQACTQQSKEGHFPCAGSANGYCAESWCTYWPVCTKNEPTPADYAEVEERQEIRRAALGLGRSGNFKRHNEALAAG